MEEYEVYECWVTADKDSFVKLTTVPQVMEWYKEALRKYDVGTHINVVIHLNTEYHD